MKLTYKGTEIADLVFIERPAALLEGPTGQAELVKHESQPVIKSQPVNVPTLVVDRKYSICGHCGGPIWQAYEQPDWASNVCDTCFPIIAPEEIAVQPMPQRQPRYDYLPDGSVRTQLSDPGAYVSQCEPTRCGAVTGALYVLGLWRDY